MYYYLRKKKRRLLRSSVALRSVNDNQLPIDAALDITTFEDLKFKAQDV